MKPIIIDMKDMSDSKEVYESKPNRFLVYTVYLIFVILMVAILWMSLSKVDIVTKSNGIFKGSSSVYEVNIGVTGSVKETHIEDGQYVAEGDVLCVLSVDELSDTILHYQHELEDAQDRLEILEEYDKSLNGDKSGLEALSDNPYYKEFLNRRELLYTNIGLSDTSRQITLYQENVDSISATIATYNEKIEKLNIVKQCIMNRNNTFGVSENIYYSMVSSYLATYRYTALQYDNQIEKYQGQIDEYDVQIKKAESSGESNDIVDMENLKKQRESLVTIQDSVKNEKIQDLAKLELQQITSIEQEILGYNDTILSLKTNLISAKSQLETQKDEDGESQEKVEILTEKGNIATETLTYEEKVNECERYLKSYDIQNDNCIVKANASGYFHISQELKTGSYVQEGTTIGAIYPEAESKFYAEIYVENEDIAKVKEGQEVKFEIAAYPSSEYGYFKGTVENIAKDISVDQSTGNAYYVVKVKCENMTLKGNDGKKVMLMNGMACQAKIVIGEKNMLQFLLEKIDLLD